MRNELRDERDTRESWISSITMDHHAAKMIIKDVGERVREMAVRECTREARMIEVNEKMYSWYPNDPIMIPVREKLSEKVFEREKCV